VVGAAAGGLAGKGAGEVANPTPEDKLSHHHLAEGVGAGGGAAAGAAVGAAGGPVGMAAGAAIGAAAGSAAGKGTGKVVNPKPGDKSPV
jgi:phage tail tape-measure protein